MNKRRNSENGVAILMVLLALVVLSAIAVGLVYMTNTETTVNSNYRSEQVAYFAAKAGIEEARDRMMLNLPGARYFANDPANPLPIQPPTAANQGILYILNEGDQPGTVQPWSVDNKYMDDELCHDGYAVFPAGTVVPDPGVHCTDLPAGGGWYTTTTSQLPFNGSSAAVPFKWVRVALKLNGSLQNYKVNGALGVSPATPVCWNGAREVLLTKPSCDKMDPPATQVYLLTSLAVSQTGARKMVQADVALNPTSAFPYGLFGTGTGCGVVSFTGNGWTDSFDGSKGNYDSTKKNTGGDIGSNGNVLLTGNGLIGGSVGVLPPAVGKPIVAGPCPPSNYTINGGNAGLFGDPANVLSPLAQIMTFPTPPSPIPPPPLTNVQYTSDTTLVPGTYGNLSASSKATLTLAPGVYNINSLSLSGQASITITPKGQVVLNIAGACASPCASPGVVLDLSGQSVNNQTLDAKQFQINYGGTGSVNVTGNASTSYFVLNAPNSAVKIAGNGDIFGAVLGKTIEDVGNGGFHYDKSVSLAPPSTGALQMISFRHIPY
jgi:hypothetical protein